MAHETFGSRFVGARGLAAWHVIGTVIEPGRKISVEEALEVGGIDFEYVMAPAGFQLPSGEFVYDGTQQAVLRSPTADRPQWDNLGFVGPNYQILQNIELARGLDALAQKTGWEFETVGALQQGKTVFMTLRTGKRSVFGDDYDTFVGVIDGKAANRALTITVGGVRIVCMNTVRLAESRAMHKIQIAHDAAVAGNYQMWIDLMGQIQAAQDEYFAQLERLASVKINARQAKSVINAAFPVPRKGTLVRQYDAIKERTDLAESARVKILDSLQKTVDQHDFNAAKAQARREASFVCYERLNAGDEQGAHGGARVSAETLATISETPYAAFQAVSEVVDWGGSGSDKSVAESALFGKGAVAKDRAFAAAIKLVEA